MITWETLTPHPLSSAGGLSYSLGPSAQQFLKLALEEFFTKDGAGFLWLFFFLLQLTCVNCLSKGFTSKDSKPKISPESPDGVVASL